MSPHEKACLRCGCRMDCSRFDSPEGLDWVRGCAGHGYYPDPFEQRCQQLEQTARDMYGSMAVSFSRKKPIRMEQIHEAIIELEALGVSLDD